MGTGYYVLLLLVAYYFTSFDPRRNAFDPDETESTSTSWWEPNPIDVLILDLVRRKGVLRWLRRRFPNLGEAFVTVRSTGSNERMVILTVCA